MTLFRILTVLSGLLPSLALAVTLPDAPCDPQQFGCGLPADNVIYNMVVAQGGIASIMLQIAGGLSVVVIIGAGIEMMISLGDEGKITQYKWAMAYAMIGLSVAILAQFIISAVGTQEYGQSATSGNLPLIIIANAGVILRTVLNAIFIMMLVLAALKMLYSQGKADDYNSGKKMLYWGMAGAVIVNLAAALAYSVSSFFGV